MKLRGLIEDFFTEINFKFCRCGSTFHQTISQQILSFHNFEEDYLHFLTQYLRFLAFCQKTIEFFDMYWLFEPFADEEFVDSLFMFSAKYPDAGLILYLPTSDIVFMLTSLAENYLWLKNLGLSIPLVFFFIKSIICTSLFSILTLDIFRLENLVLYFDFLSQLFLIYDTVEELRVLFILFNFYNFELILNIFFFSLKYDIYPWYMGLYSKSEYFFIPLGILINFIIAFLLLFLVYIINRGTGISDLEKTSAYECGFDPFKDSRQLTDINFFRVAVLFILFDLEIIYLIPWIFILYASFYNYYIIIGGFSYLFILSLGLLFEYKSKMLDW
jgi:NADH:ubiquinone oxidoreductase subunit 3 (subunit A)